MDRGWLDGCLAGLLAGCQIVISSSSLSLYLSLFALSRSSVSIIRLLEVTD